VSGYGTKARSCLEATGRPASQTTATCGNVLAARASN
jgi:hypothetical protein